MNAPQDTNPWKGLSPFEEADKGLFFGRGLEVQDLFERVERHALTVLFARSGLGKTSLLRAGLIPRLRKAGFTPVLVRFDFGPQDPPLRRQLRTLIAASVGSKPLSSSVPLWQWAHDRQEGLLSPGLEGIEPVLIFDQFEEIYTLGGSGEAAKTGLTPEEAKAHAEAAAVMADEVTALLEELADLAENRPPAALAKLAAADPGLWERHDRNASPIRLLVTLREDYLSKLEASRPSMPSMMRNRMLLTPLSYKGALEAVRSPAPHRVSPEEAQGIVRFVADREGAPRPEDQLWVDPAILSLVCERLARRHQPEEPIRLGDMRGREEIIAEYYDECFKDQPPALQIVIEKCLLTASGYRDSAAKETVEGELKDRGIAQPRKLLDELTRLRLITEEERGGQLRRIELTHDRLADVAKARRDARRSNEEEAKAEALRREAEASQREAEDRAKEERRAKQERRRLRLTALVMSALGAVALICAIWAVAGARAAKASRKVALEQSVKAREQSAKAKEARDQAKTQAVLAKSESLAALKALKGEQEALKKAGYRELNLVEEMLNKKNPGDALAHLAEHSTTNPGFTLPFEKALYELNTLQPSTLLAGHTAYLRWAEFSPDGQYVVTASDDATARLWETKTGRLLTVLSGHELQTQMAKSSLDQGQSPGLWMARFSPQFGPDGGFIATAGVDGTARIWDVRDPAHLPSALEASLILYPSGQGVRLVGGSPTVEPATATASTFEGPALRVAAFSPDGKCLVTGGYEGRLVWWDLSKYCQPGALKVAGVKLDATQDPGIPVRFIKLEQPDPAQIVVPPAKEGKLAPSPILAAEFSPDSRRICVHTSSDRGLAWEPATGTTWEYAGNVVDNLVFHPKDSSLLLAALSSPFEPRILKIPEKPGDPLTVVSTLEGKSPHTAGVYSVCFRPDGLAFIATSYDQTASVWTCSADGTKITLDAVLEGDPITVGRVPLIESGRAMSDGHKSTVVVGYFCPHDPDKIVTCSVDGTARLWRLDRDKDGKLKHTARTLAVLYGHTGPVYDCQFAPDGRRLVTFSFDKTARIWDAGGFQMLQSVVNAEAPNSVVTSASFDLEGRRLVVGSNASSLTLRDGATLAVQTVIAGRKGSSRAARFTPEPASRAIVSTGEFDQQVMRWQGDAQGQTWTPTALGSTDAVSGLVEISSDCRLALTGGWTTAAYVWNLAGASPLYRTFKAPKAAPQYVWWSMFSPDQKQVLVCGNDPVVRLWDIERQAAMTFPNEREPASGHTLEVHTGAFSQDGRLLVTAGQDNLAKIWRVADGHLLFDLKGHQAAIWTVQFVNNDKQVATGSSDATVRVWDVATGRQVAVLPHGHVADVRRPIPGTQRMVTCCADRYYRVWDTQSWQLVATLRGQRDVHLYAAFDISPDGNRIATGGWDGVLRLWATPGKLKERPAWAADFLLWAGQRRLDKYGAITSIGAEDEDEETAAEPGTKPVRLPGRRTLETRLREQLKDDPSQAAKMARWFMLPPEERVEWPAFELGGGK